MFYIAHCRSETMTTSIQFGSYLYNLRQKLFSKNLPCIHGLTTAFSAHQARAVPAHRQRRLFDETREAEKVVQFLAGMSPGDMAQLLLPILLQAAHVR